MMHTHGPEIENVSWCRACVSEMTPREFLENIIYHVICSSEGTTWRVRTRRIAEAIMPLDRIATRLTVGILFNKHSKWIGIHYSHKELRYCINVVPMLTIYIVKKDGIIP